MTQRNVYAHTKNDPIDGYVPYVSLNAQPDGSYVLTVRGNGATTASIPLTPANIVDMSAHLSAEVSTHIRSS